MAYSEYYEQGVYSWTCPSWVTSITVECYGAGGGGGAGSYFQGQGGGGGAGGYATKVISVTPNSSYNVFVGGGGYGGSFGSDGGAGGDSYFVNSSTVIGYGGGGGYSFDMGVTAVTAVVMVVLVLQGLLVIVEASTEMEDMVLSVVEEMAALLLNLQTE